MNWDYKDFKKAVFELTNINLSYYKERQMKRRIDSLINRNNYKGYYEYYQALLQDKELLEQFIDYLTINVSEFYRNPGQWEILKKEILPKLLNTRSNRLKIWSAACSTGEEPYTIVMILREYLPFDKIHILATDIDKEAIRKAKKGVYIEKSLESLPKVYIRNYFTKEANMYKISDQIKSCVEFRHHNLLEDDFPKDCDLIVCRNVLIYFTEEAKIMLYKKFYDALQEEGVLFVGSTEQIIFPQRYGFKSIHTFFYKKDL